MTELVEDLSRLFASRWPHVTLTVNVEEMRATFDRDQLSQAIWALLQNAVEAVRAAALAHTVGLSATRDGAALIIDVTDNGVGVLPDLSTAMFRPFVTTKSSGTGIGLSLVRQIAQAHGVTVDVAATRPVTIRLKIPFLTDSHPI